MGVDHIRRAMNAGSRWAEKQLSAGVSITPEAVEKAAADRFDHRGSQYLFVTSALDVLQQWEAQAANLEQH